MAQSSRCILKTPSPDTVYILDIDSTLVSTHQRNQAILNQYCQDYQIEHSEDCEVIQRVRCQPGDYGFKTGLQRLGLEIEDLKNSEHLRQYWRQHFFSNRFLTEDRANPCAPEWVQNLSHFGVTFYYLTARPKPTMWEGTLATMAKMGFPIAPQILFLKEDPDEADEDYKVQLLQQLLQGRSQTKRWVLIDNEPVVLNAVARSHPEVELVWYDSTHSGRMQPPPHARRITDFCFSQGS